jgi:hypothetical protein
MRRLIVAVAAVAFCLYEKARARTGTAEALIEALGKP